MAILFSQADGSDQHYDTYEEFEQAFILLKRLNGEEVPQDLLDEFKAKYGDKDPEPFKVEIDGDNFESAIREAVREVGEELDIISKGRTPVSDECGIPGNGPKFRSGDQVKVVNNTSSGHVDGTVGEIIGVGYVEYENRWSYEVRPISEYLFEHSLSHKESDLELLDVCDNDFEVGDKVEPLGKDELLPVGTKVRMLRPSSCGDLRPGDVGTITATDIRCSMGLVYSVRVRSGEVGYGWIGRDGVEVDEEGSPTEFRDGDLVRVTESFGDSFGDVAGIHSVLTVRIDGTGRVLGVGKVLIGENHDKLQLVCRKEDRKDIEL